MDRSIAVVRYDPHWPSCFEGERALLSLVLGNRLEDDIHHVGSTAVPGLASKPVIDILAGVRDLEESRAVFGPLREHFYVHAPHRPGIAHHFSKPSTRVSELRFNLHLTVPASDLWRERLVFRDALRSDPMLAAQYEALKVRLVQEHVDDVAGYTDGKRDFVARVLAGAGVPLGRR